MPKSFVSFISVMICLTGHALAADSWTEQIPTSLANCKRVFPGDLQLQQGCMENEKTAFHKIKQYEQIAEPKTSAKESNQSAISDIENEFPSVTCATAEKCRQIGGELNLANKEKKALPYFAASCIKGAAGSCQLLGRYYEKKPDLSFKWYRRACEESQDLESCMPAISISLDKNKSEEAVRLLNHCCSLEKNQKWCKIYLEMEYFKKSKKKKMVTDACKLGNQYLCEIVPLL